MAVDTWCSEQSPPGAAFTASVVLINYTTGGLKARMAPVTHLLELYSLLPSTAALTYSTKVDICIEFVHTHADTHRFSVSGDSTKPG